jgi:hypothetical protein
MEYKIMFSFSHLILSVAILWCDLVGMVTPFPAHIAPNLIQVTGTRGNWQSAINSIQKRSKRICGSTFTILILFTNYRNTNSKLQVCGCDIDWEQNSVQALKMLEIGARFVRRFLLSRD